MVLVRCFPVAVLTDSYKVSHFAQYPADCVRMSAYGEFRTPMDKDYSERRVIWYGIRYVIETHLNRRWTIKDVERAEAFFSTHNVGKTPFKFPKELFLQFISENDGYFPVKIETLPEGSVVHIHTPVYQISASGPYARLVTYFETLLTMVWYPATVATLSRYIHDNIRQAFEASADDCANTLIASRLHDFGFRGCTCVEQAALGGSAHLLNFNGTDTLAAAYYVQYSLNNGKPVGESIPATEHSVMTSWKTERDACLNMIANYGTGLFATVMDTYDYANCLENVVAQCKEAKLAQKSGFWIFRPDSGDQIETVLMALRAGEKHFGADVNSKGYKVLRGCGCIQGDSVDRGVIRQILSAAEAEGFSAQNISFGMGGALLQKINRDTMGFATKLSFIEYGNGEQRDVMKAPKSDPNKFSLPGILRVKRDRNTGQEIVMPRDPGDTSYEDDDLLRPVYDCGPLSECWDDFDGIRERIQEQWPRAQKEYDPISAELKEKIAEWIATQSAIFSQEYNAVFEAAERRE